MASESNMENIIKEITQRTNVDEGGINLSARTAKNKPVFFRYYENNKIPFDIKMLKDVLYQDSILNISQQRKDAGHTGEISNPHYEGGRLLRKKVEISKKKLITDSDTDENLWERIITIINSQLYNQTCVGAQNREQVDLIYSSDGIKREKLIELKTKIGTNNPLSAFVEILKNYVLTELTTKEQNNEQADINTLILLAPKYYYDYYFNCNNFKKEFFNLITSFNKKEYFPVTFELKYIDITKKEMENFVCKLRKNVNDNEIFPLHLLIEYLDYSEFRNIRHNLYINNWKVYN